MVMKSSLVMSTVVTLVAVGLNCSTVVVSEEVSPQQSRPGYTDTPFLPGGKWKVHDPERPYPRVVTPGNPQESGQLTQPPSDALVLFDGSDLSQWLTDTEGPPHGSPGEPGWKVQNGFMEVVPGSGSIRSKETFGDCQIHIEWATPENPVGTSQGRGNSGVLIMGRYEIQVLDSYENPTYADGQAAAMYGQYPPLVNASRAPGEWQTFDLVFEAPRFEGDRLAKPAWVTVLHNRILVHHRRAFIGQVTHRRLATYSPHASEGPLLLQNHGNPVRYRNIWVRRLELSDP